MKGFISTAARPTCSATSPKFDFRYNRRTALGFTDKMRVDAIMEGIEGKRLTYRRTGEAQNA